MLWTQNKARAVGVPGRAARLRRTAWRKEKGRRPMRVSGLIPAGEARSGLFVFAFRGRSRLAFLGGSGFLGGSRFLSGSSFIGSNGFVSCTFLRDRGELFGSQRRRLLLKHLLQDVDALRLEIRLLGR